MTKHIHNGVPVTKGKMKSDVNTISDLVRVEKYVDNNIQIFSSLIMRSYMKNVNRKVLSIFCSGMLETLQQKKFKMVLFRLSENNCHDY